MPKQIRELRPGLTDEDFSLGSPEAWDRAEQENLSRRFLPISQFINISSSQKIFLCGRRGSGKSAIALMLKGTSGYSFTEAVQGEASEYGAYMDVVRTVCKKRDEAKKDVDIKKSIRRLWMWVLPVKAMQTVLNQSIQHGYPLDEDLETIWKYLSSLPSPMNEESSIGHLLMNVFQLANAQLDISESHYDTFLLNLSNEVKYKLAFEALHRKTRNARTLLVLDTLESYRIFESPMIEGLKGILEAVNALRGEARLEFVSLKFFMPAEIYDSVFNEFPGKVQSSAVFLRWSAANLMTMLARRFLDVLIRTGAVTDAEAVLYGEQVAEAYRQQDGRHLRETFWYGTGFLPRTIRNTLGKEEDCFAYMFRHSQRRPRDLLAQMKAVVLESRKREEFPFLSTESVVLGIHSEAPLVQILGDALTPYEGSLPGKLLDAARAVFYERPRILSGRELKNFAKELYNLYPLLNVEPDEFVRALLKCGVIGLLGETLQPNTDTTEADTAAGPYRKASFEYVMQGNLPVAERFNYCIHPAMADVFKTRLPEDGLAIYPLPDRDEGTWLEEAIGII